MYSLVYDSPCPNCPCSPSPHEYTVRISSSAFGTYFGFQPSIDAEILLLLPRFFLDPLLPIVDCPPILDFRVMSFESTEPRLFPAALFAALPSADFLYLNPDIRSSAAIRHKPSITATTHLLFLANFIHLFFGHCWRFTKIDTQAK